MFQWYNGSFGFLGFTFFFIRWLCTLLRLLFRRLRPILAVSLLLLLFKGRLLRGWTREARLRKQEEYNAKGANYDVADHIN